MEERRGEARVRQRLTVLFRALDGQRIGRALTKDIGADGVCLITEGVLEPGTQMELEVRFPDREQPITLAAEVVWSKLLDQPAKSYETPTAETGLKFVRIDPRDRSFIVQYVMLNTSPL
ncbi:MAG: PilZ domain-containing protein [Candidatus Omnitrophica bacterium]|nr:PilZ domain-containing protein [Candidatus Omnitrophota bacterium]MBI3021120.1 PilZ domain-containing protein [Candidatus Omnitrophota bacterium]